MLGLRIWLLVAFVCNAKALASTQHQHNNEQQLMQQLHELQSDLGTFVGDREFEEVDLAEVNLFWADLANRVGTYYSHMRSTMTLDSRFAMFQMQGEVFGVLSRALSASAEMGAALVDFEEKLERGELDTANKAMQECVRAATTFERVSLASGAAKTAIGLLTLGISEGAGQIFQIANSTVTTVGSGVSGTINDTTTAQKIGNIVEVTATTVGDVLWGIATLGIAPVLGLIAEKSIEARKIEWAEDMKAAACMLGAFAIVADRVGIRSSVGAQALQYRVSGAPTILSNLGKFSSLSKRALKEYTANPEVGGIIASEDILQMLEEDLGNLQRASQTAKIVKGPFGGVSETIRHYAVGNAFEKASKFAGVSTVAFAMSKYWARYLAALDEGRIELSKAGLIKDLVGRAHTSDYQNLYARFGRGYGFAPGDAYEDAYGCRKGKCWRRCAEERDESKNYCYIRSQANPSGVAECKTREDCFHKHMQGVDDIRSLRCHTRCGLLHHWW